MSSNTRCQLLGLPGVSRPGTRGTPPRLPPKPRILTLSPGLILVRFYQPRGGDWSTRRRYGPLDDVRFDHHPPPCRMHDRHSVWYAATSFVGAVAEAFGRRGWIDRAARLRMVRAKVQGELRVLDLVGLAARAVGLTQEIAATTDYALCQEWARAIYRLVPGVHGIRWRGRQSGSLCVVLHDRAEMGRLDGESWSIVDPAVWPRVARAARECRLAIVG